MRFGLIDRVLEFEAGKRIVAVKAVSLAEEYLAEHFPTFPVLPGVFMLECMMEAARWLVHATQGFEHGIILPESVKGVTYKSFVAPGRLLRVEVDCLRLAPRESKFTGAGYCEETEVVKGRFALTHFNLAERSPGLASTDRRIVEEARVRWGLIGPVSERVEAPSA